MTQRFYPFDAGPGANVTEDQWREMARHWLSTGVVAGERENLRVFADSSGLLVKVRPGVAYVRGHFYDSDAEEVLPISEADPANPRRDRVVLRADFVANTIVLAVLQGAPATTPAPPVLTQSTSRWETPVAIVDVPAGAATIAAANVVDERRYSGRVPSGGTAAQVATRQADGTIAWITGVSAMVDSSPTTPPDFYPLGNSTAFWAVGLAGAPNSTSSFTVQTTKHSSISLFQIVIERALTPKGNEKFYFRIGRAQASPEWAPWQLVSATAV